MRPLVAHCHLGFGTLFQRTGKREQAGEHLATATTLYREMDMRFWLEQAEALTRLLTPWANVSPPRRRQMRCKWWQPLPLVAQMRSADRVRKCLLFGVDRTYDGHHQTDATDPKPTSARLEI
jgi:hypothetical protein